MPSRDAQLLLVDDDPSSIQVMSRMLAQYPAQRFATSGEAAIRLAREAAPDLILMDVEMPGMTGFEVSECLKDDPTLASVPVIFVTSHGGSDMLQVTAWQKGAADFVNKPLVASQLTARVGAQLRARLLVKDLKRDQVFVERPSHPGDQVPRVLIVDDDTASIHILRHMLASMGELYFAKTGTEALQVARRIVPDLILLDAHMPGVDGFDVCRSLKAEAPFNHVPIAFVTRFSDPRYEMRALDLGAADFIAKPYTPAVLQARVQNLLALKRRTDAEIQAVREHWRQVGDARVADIVGAASDAIVTCNAQDNVVLMNAAACRMFGVGHEQAIGSPVQALLGADLRLRDWEHSDAASIVIARPDGVRLSLELSVSRVGKGIDRLTTMMLRDNSDRERIEVEMRSRVEAETASRTKTMMMSYIAHEMGNPLTSLLGFAQIMVADVGSPLPPVQAKRLNQVVTNARRLQRLMRDVMDLGCLETGKLTIDLVTVDAIQCAVDAAAAVSAQAEQSGVTLSCLPASAPCWVYADAQRLHQCLVNLLTNAIKYNQSGGRASIETTGDAQAVAIAVSDNGAGMDALQRQHLFEPFNRLGKHSGTAAGTGLGLVITRQLVEAMNGHLRVDSEPGQGSCFTIALPGAPPATAAHG
jgi:PAS domain S-box-containing protein